MDNTHCNSNANTNLMFLASYKKYKIFWNNIMGQFKLTYTPLSSNAQSHLAGGSL